MVCFFDGRHDGLLHTLLWNPILWNLVLEKVVSRDGLWDTSLWNPILWNLVLENVVRQRINGVTYISRYLCA